MHSGLILEVERSEVLPLFPSFVWQTRLTPTVARAMNDAMVARLDTLRAELPPLMPGHTFQSEQNLHEDPAFAGLVGLINNAVSGVLEYLKVKHQRSVITGLWANVGAPHAGHTPHTHPNNYLSGVYYIRAPEGANRITFDDPRPQTYVLSPMVSKVSPDNGSFVNVTIDEGFLLIFPAWLQHRVPPNLSPRERVSVSFNAMFADFAETLAQED